MARPQRNTVEYFPHPVTHGKKMSYLEKKYGNDGYAVWFKILEELGNTDFHYLDLSDDVQIMFLSDRCLVTEDVLMSIINDLIRLKEFDKNLWENNKILFNEKFIESIKDAYKKRSNVCVDKKSLLHLLEGLGIRKPSKSNRKPQKSTLEGDVNPQTKLKESKEEKSKVEVYRKFAHLSLAKNEFEKLNETYSKNQIDGVLDAIENWKKNTSYKSLYLTANKWLKKEYPNQETSQQKKSDNEPPMSMTQFITA